MRPSRLGRGLDSLIHAVEDDEKENKTPHTIPPDPSTPLQWPVEHPDALTPTPLRLEVRSSLEKLSTRPRHGLKAARAYLDHLRQIDGRTSIDLDISRVDLTGLTMIQLTRGRVVDSIRHSFFGLVSVWT